MKLKDYIIIGIILIGVVFFLEWRANQRESQRNSQLTSISNQFRQLADGKSAKSEINVVAQPGLFDKIFNTALNKQYKDIRNMIPSVIADEIKKVNLENKFTTINKSSILIEGDSVVYRNEDGVITKTAKVIPVDGDSSLLIIVPQEIEIMNVMVQPDQNRPDSLQIFLSAYNKTTGDTLKIGKSVTYVLPGSTKKWHFGFNPYIAGGYDILNKETIFKSGISPINYNGKNINASFMGLELSAGVKGTTGIEVQFLKLQLKNKK